MQRDAISVMSDCHSSGCRLLWEVTPPLCGGGVTMAFWLKPARPFYETGLLTSPFHMHLGCQSVWTDKQHNDFMPDDRYTAKCLFIFGPVIMTAKLFWRKQWLREYKKIGKYIFFFFKTKAVDLWYPLKTMLVTQIHNSGSLPHNEANCWQSNYSVTVLMHNYLHKIIETTRTLL